MKQYCVTGMSCAACAARVEKAVSAVPGVTSVSVSLLTNGMGVEGTAADVAATCVRISGQYALFSTMPRMPRTCPSMRFRRLMRAFISSGVRSLCLWQASH